VHNDFGAMEESLA